MAGRRRGARGQGPPEQKQNLWQWPRGGEITPNSNAPRSGKFVWDEHLTKDAKGAIGFYSDVVGWKTQPLPEGGEHHVIARGRSGA